MIECEKLVGRMRQICEGRDGHGNPISVLPMDRVKYLQKFFPNADETEIITHVQMGAPTSHMRGMGDLIAAGIRKATFGLVSPCGGCKDRQQKLNELIPFKPKEPKPSVKNQSRVLVSVQDIR